MPPVSKTSAQAAPLRSPLRNPHAAARSATCAGLPAVPSGLQLKRSISPWLTHPLRWAMNPICISGDAHACRRALSPNL